MEGKVVTTHLIIQQPDVNVAGNALRGGERGGIQRLETGQIAGSKLIRFLLISGGDVGQFVLGNAKGIGEAQFRGPFGITAQHLGEDLREEGVRVEGVPLLRGHGRDGGQRGGGRGRGGGGDGWGSAAGNQNEE